VVPIGIVAIGASKGVQMFEMAPQVTNPISGFSIGNLMPYFQPPARNPPSRFGNFGGGIPIGGSGNPLHGSGRPLGRGSGPSRGGGRPLGERRPMAGSGPPNNKGPLGGGGNGFPVGG
jgi:hypothetical protein